MGNFDIYWQGILMSYAAFFLGIASPGPNILAVIGTSMSQGRKSGLSLGLGVALGSFCWAIFTVVGLSALLALYASVLTVIKVFGGCYLLWLAYKSFKSASKSHDIHTTEMSDDGKGVFGYFFRGLFVQMTNPKAALSWIAIISLGLTEGAPFWVEATIVGGTFTLSIIFHSLYALAFSTPVMVRLYSKARRTIQITLGTFFAFAGVKLLHSEV